MKKTLCLCLCLALFGCADKTPETQYKKVNTTTIPYPTDSPSGFSIACAKQQYNPVCAEVQVQCVQAPCDPIQQTFPNLCAANEAQATVLKETSCEEISVPTESDDLYNAFFIDRDTSKCAVIRFTCEENQSPFSDERGCGCITNPEKDPETETDKSILYENILIYGESPKQCPSKETKFDCPPTWTTYNNESGCGCFKE